MSDEKHLAKFHPFELRVCRTIDEYGMLNRGEHVVVGVSGGADSIALLLCLNKIAPERGLTLTVAHLNHRIRGAEADEDESYVRRLCADLGVPFVSEAIEIKQLARSTKQNLEELARDKRYDFLRRTAIRVGAQKIAVGHSLNDQAETTLFRFLRGSGIEGLSGIHPVVEGTIIRPLLKCSRALIAGYLQDRRVPFREDSTNNDFRYSRNRIRQELMPYLEKSFNPQLVSTLAREASMARETWSFIEAEAKQCFDMLHSCKEGAIEFKAANLLKLHPALRKQVVREALRACLGSLRGITSAHVESVLALCQGRGEHATVDLPHRSIAERQFDSVFLRKQVPAAPPAFEYDLEIPGKCTIEETGVVFTAGLCGTPDFSMIKDRWSERAFLETSALPGRLTIRSRKPGDRYGGPGHRKVKKMLIDSRIPVHRRSFLPMVAADADVIWIPGFRPARSYEVRPGSLDCVVVTYQEPVVRSQKPEG